MENIINHQSSEFQNILMEQHKDCLDYIKDFK